MTPPGETPYPVVQLELPAQPAFHAVGRLVVGGVASRLDFEIADIEDLQLAVEAVLCRRPARSTVTVTLTPSHTDLQARLGPFAANGDRERLEGMLRHLVQHAVVQDWGEDEWVVMRAARERARAPGSS
jgi:glucose-6-phosphate dehydrogenase assembly protein OpcA